jgi:general secretion pathway protein G
MTARKRKGFSLGEILVAVAILAVIAAVIIPSIGGQLNKGESARISNDLVGIRSGVEQFLADVRRYPSSLVQLQTKPTAALASDTGANASGTFTALQVARWKGPYLSKDLSGSVSGVSGVSGYGVQLPQWFTVCNNANPTLCTANPAGQRYLSIQISGLSTTEATEIDAAMDDGSLTSGQIRYTAANILVYLAVPIQ